MIKNFFFLLLLLTAALVLAYLDLINYGLGQAKGQLHVINNSVPLEEVLEDPRYPDSLKQKLVLIDEVRQFAVESIGLKNSDNYTTFFDQQGKDILWNLSACEPYSFTPKTWGFPILGSFPYKGFFDLEKAKDEKKVLDSLHFDTRIRRVSGWSTLGWFSDPILSNMLKRSDGRLAELIVHELTHATVFVKDDIQFNENLASFIGEQGALLFLEDKFGRDSQELADYQKQRVDDKLFTAQMLNGYQLLDSLYNSFQSRLSDSTKEIQKHLLIDEITSSVDTLAFQNKRYYLIFEKGKPNNAYFMSFQRYHSAEDSLQAILSETYKGNLSAFVRGMKDYHN